MSRGVKISTPLGDDALLFERMTGEERISDPFRYDVSVLSENPNLDLSALLGKKVTVEVEQAGDQTRRFNGYVAAFSMDDNATRHVRYRLTLRPWLWLLSLSATSRIFQKMTVPEIVKDIFRLHGFSDFRESLSDSYRQWEYSVQYRETDLNYVSRLLEQEGIYYFVEHSDGKHTIVLADGPSSHQPSPGYEEIELFPPGDSDARAQEHLHTWNAGRRLRTGQFSSSDYDFERPKASLAARLKRPLEQEFADLETYDFPGEYLKTSEGNKYVQVRLDQHQSDFELVHAAGNTRGMTTGAVFKLKNNDRDDQNVEHLVIGARYSIANPEYQSGDDDGEHFEGTYVCINAKRPYRPAPHTPRPRVDGPQTAMVVGPDGEEIYVDKYGRVKVQFHWDREGQNDENSSCWVRVAQVWAGAKWGAMHIPRIGQEVIVDFLEGDPDRPIITGRVYNGDNMPPYDLPDNKTQSGIKSRSTPKGAPSNFNEIRFEDKKGAEELHVQAERDQTTHVKRNQSISVDGDRSVSVGGNETITVKGTRTTTITKKETENFNDDREMTVVKKNTETVHGGRDVTIQQNDALTVLASNKTDTIHGNYTITADAQFQVTQGSNVLLIQEKIDAGTVGPIAIHNPTSSVEMKGGVVTVTSANEIVLSCGGAKLSLKADGTIEMTGQTVKTGNANNNAVFEPAGTTLNGVKITSAAVGVHEINGALIKIG